MTTCKFTKEVITLWYRCPEILMGDDSYTSAVDIWSIGCIMFELAHRRVLFCGDSDIGQLFKIFEVIGTPTEDTWPGFTTQKYFKATFPSFKGKDLTQYCHNFSPLAIDLWTQLCDPCPETRIQASKALYHEWFDDLDKSKYDDPNSY